MFESLEKAKAAYASTAYLEARKIGNQYGKLRIFAVEGIAQEQSEPSKFSLQRARLITWVFVKSTHQQVGPAARIDPPTNAVNSRISIRTFCASQSELHAAQGKEPGHGKGM